MMGNIFSPFEFLCQVLPLSEKQRKELDNEFENRMNADGFEKNVDRIVFDLSQSSGTFSPQHYDILKDRLHVTLVYIDIAFISPIRKLICFI